MKTLRPYQQGALGWLTERGRGLLAYPPGVGKTAIGSRWVCQHQVPSLIVAPNGPVLKHWQSEYHEFTGCASVLGCGSAKRRATARELIADKVADCLILNYEAMRADIDELLKIGFQTVLFDESHRMKSHKSLTYKAGVKLARRADYVALMSGTPILNSVDELWTSFAILAPDKYKSYWRWVERNCEIEMKMIRGRTVRKVGHVRSDRLTAVAQEAQRYATFATAEELLPSLPELTETYLEVELTAPERKVYNQMRDKLWMELPNGVLTADSAVTKSTRLRQLASDWTCFDGILEPGSKVKAAAELISDSEDQWVVFCAFKSTANALSRLVPHSVVYHGDLTPSQRETARGLFMDQKAQVIIGTFETMGEGIDGLQCARNVIMLDRQWTPARNEQAIGRCHRSGQKDGVNVVHLTANDTIDQRVTDALRTKQRVIDALVKGI